MFCTNLRRGPYDRHCAGFTRTDLIVVTVVLGMTLSLFPACLHNARNAARRNWCISNMKQIALGVLNMESATTRYPLASLPPKLANVGLTKISPGTVDDDPALSSGYSWLTLILPYMEEKLLYDAIVEGSGKFKKAAFDNDILALNGGHASTVRINALLCPTFSGSPVVCDEYFSSQGSKTMEYANLGLPGGLPATGTYVALVGTHCDSINGLQENGVIVSSNVNAARGLRRRDIMDGTATTVMACESREESYASWYDGQATWVVGADPNVSGIENSKTTAARQLMNIGPARYGGSCYSDIAFPQGAWPGVAPRQWGPSSEHPGGVVVHSFADGHVQAIRDNISPSVYCQLITRNGQEPIDRDEYE